jgi:hypothetical protein
MVQAALLQVMVMLRSLQAPVINLRATTQRRLVHGTRRTAIGSSQAHINHVTVQVRVPLQVTDQAPTLHVTANQQTGSSHNQVTVDHKCTQKLAHTANDQSEKTKTSVPTATKEYSTNA